MSWFNTTRVQPVLLLCCYTVMLLFCYAVVPLFCYAVIQPVMLNTLMEKGRSQASNSPASCFQTWLPYIVTLLHCYIVSLTMLQCCIVTLLHWQRRSANSPSNSFQTASFCRTKDHRSLYLYWWRTASNSPVNSFQTSSKYDIIKKTTEVQFYWNVICKKLYIFFQPSFFCRTKDCWSTMSFKKIREDNSIKNLDGEGTISSSQFKSKHHFLARTR